VAAPIIGRGNAATKAITSNLWPPQFVRPYVKSHKNDMRDAEAIAEAVTRPAMRFVPVKMVR
jgi:transposase